MNELLINDLWWRSLGIIEIERSNMLLILLLIKIAIQYNKLIKKWWLTDIKRNVFESTTKFLIEGIINGYNATVFVYGATGAGKTYT